MKYEFPVKLHRYTTEEFNRKKAEYVSKYGYTMHIPGFSDIIKFSLIPPPSEEEVKLYRKKDIESLGAMRYQDIKNLFAQKKESYLRMMSSPTPSWIQDIGTTMTLLDDVNDALGTLAVICRTVALLVPKSIAKGLMGPAGWAMLAADVVNVASISMNAPTSYLSTKADLNAALAKNPFSKEAKVKRAKRLSKLKPTAGETIELLQTTENMFGIGLSLGPILGALIEAVTGPFRVLQGESVTVDWPIPDWSDTEMAAMEGIYGAYMLNTGGQELSPLDHTKTYLVAEMATQVLYPAFKEYHPLDHIHGIENIILPAPKPRDPLTKLLFDEVGLHWPSNTGHLHTGRQFVSVRELMDVGDHRIARSFKEYSQTQKHTVLGQLGCQAVNAFTENALALWEGEEAVEIDLHPALKACYKIIDNGYTFPAGITHEQTEAFAERILYPPPKGLNPSFRTIQKEICPRCGIKLIRRPVF